jgi:hypothetical protein
LRATIAVVTACLCLAAFAAADETDFEHDVAPLLVRHCAGCHNAADPAGELDLTSPAAARKGGESGSPAIVPGRPDQSYLVERLRAAEMPPEGKGTPLAADEVARLEHWIQSGAPWPAKRVLSPFEFTTDKRAGLDWWSLQTPRPPAVPAVARADRVRTPIDRFVLARLEAAGLEPAPQADRATLIRRAALDLLGLPPSPEEVAAFAADQAPDAYEKLVDRLLASPHYGERWARHWLDVVRFGESNGYETNTARPNAWPYRDWVIAAFNDDLPYPQFILRQLAGDQLEVDAATGFLVGGAHDTVQSPDLGLTLQQRANDLDDMISTTAGAFLGLTAGCARCHDHKFDPIAQRDYYSLAAVFAGVEHGQRELRASDFDARRRHEARLRKELDTLERRLDELTARHQPLAHLDDSSPAAPRAPVHPRLNVDRFEPVAARFVRFTVLATNSVEPCLDELEVFTADAEPRNVALAGAGAKAAASGVFANGGNNIHQLQHVNDGKYGNGHSWISDEPGGGWVQIELDEPATIDRVVWARDREGNFADRLATRYRIEVSANAGDWRLVAGGDDRRPFDPAAAGADPPRAAGLPADVAEQVADVERQMRKLNDQMAQLVPAMGYVGTFKQPEATHVLYRGEPLQRRDAVSPGGIAAVGRFSLPADAPEAARRLALARWIGSPQNPLTARVMVNRIWHYHFGSGLVSTPGDFGWGGGRPSHPELLDYLATEFMSAGWRPKAIHRLIMLSGTYRQSSRHDSRAAARDADNRLLWRYSPRRLEAEAIRDGILAASGALDLRMGGPGYDVFEPNTNYVKVYKPKQVFGPAEWRRMVYQDKPRSRGDATFAAFDCPDASQQLAKRNVSTTALQALNLLNAPFVVQQSERFAERLSREAPEVDERIRLAFRLAFAREPADSELAAARHLIESHGLAIFCRALFNANEFLYVN